MNHAAGGRRHHRDHVVVITPNAGPLFRPVAGPAPSSRHEQVGNAGVISAAEGPGAARAQPARGECGRGQTILPIDDQCRPATSIPACRRAGLRRSQRHDAGRGVVINKLLADALFPTAQSAGSCSADGKRSIIGVVSSAGIARWRNRWPTIVRADVDDAGRDCTSWPGPEAKPHASFPRSRKR